MHFSIPDTTDISARQSSNQQSYTLFNVHINGVHHCSVRYSQLHTLNEELQRLFSSAMAERKSFPPKKLFSLSARDTEERRLLLEQYLQSIAQNKYIITSSYFNEFFFNAQRESSPDDASNANAKLSLAILLLNNHEIIIENISINDNASRLLDACAAKVQLKEDFIPYFALYLYEQKEDQLNFLRSLYDFESPYLSLKQTKKSHEHACIVLKKSYWNSEYDLPLLEDRRARNLLFVQAQYEMEQSQQVYPGDIYQQLQTLRDSSSLKDYILLARTSRFYGHVFLRDCSILHPIGEPSKQKLRSCVLAIGNNELICCLNPDDTKKKSSGEKEVSFKVTRIRCWKVNWIQHDTNITLEYLIKKDHLEWIQIHTKQVALVSACLQNMVNEILSKRAGATSPAAALASAPVAEPTSPKAGNGLITRTESDLERLNNNDLFDRGGDDDL